MSLGEPDDFDDIWFLACDDTVYGGHEQSIHLSLIHI